MQTNASLFNWRFRLRSLLIVVTVACVALSSVTLLLASEAGFVALMYSFLAFCVGLCLFAIWLTARNNVSRLGLLLVCHLAIAVFLLVPIASYHINGRAWYDYGLSEWDLPPFHFSDGTVGVADYDPKFTRPAVWPIIGRFMLTMCWLSMCLMFIPPTALVFSIAVFVSAIRHRRVLTSRQSFFRMDDVANRFDSRTQLAVVGRKSI